MGPFLIFHYGDDHSLVTSPPEQEQQGHTGRRMSVGDQQPLKVTSMSVASLSNPNLLSCRLSESTGSGLG